MNRSFKTPWRVASFAACFCSFLLLTNCGPHYKKYVAPPPVPVSYSGGAADNAWMVQQTQTYKSEGAADPTAELTARMEYEREASGGKGPIHPFFSEVITPEKKKKKDKTKDKKPGDKNITAEPTPTPSPTPQAQITPAPMLIENYGPSAPQQTAPISPMPMVPAPQPGIPVHPGQ